MPKNSEKVKEASRINIRKAREKAWSLKRSPKQLMATRENLKKGINTIGKCEGCEKEFIRNSSRQKVCKKCCPDSKSSRIFFSYRITKAKHESMIATNNGMCWICLNKRATMIDHDHKTKAVRGLLCGHCNASLPMIENKELLDRALKYLLSDTYSII